MVRSTRHLHRRAGHRCSGERDQGERKLQCRHRDLEGHHCVLRDWLRCALRESGQLEAIRTLWADRVEPVWSHPNGTDGTGRRTRRHVGRCGDRVLRLYRF